MVNLRPLLPGHILLVQHSCCYTFWKPLFVGVLQLLPLICL
uniref:Uncharacterized protein n=1 Tax=Arundo donax TaxID=35708 RepID=A0A0A9F262_ARUDO